MSEKVQVGELAKSVTKLLEDYSKVTDEGMRKAVTKAAKTVKDDISANAPKNTGKYAKSWTTKKTKVTSHELQVTVYSPSRYQIAHLLENGHAKRGGGRVSGRPHIGPAEEAGASELEADIAREIGNG